jgi:hypothetical protein
MTSGDRIHLLFNVRNWSQRVYREMPVSFYLPASYYFSFHSVFDRFPCQPHDLKSVFIHTVTDFFSDKIFEVYLLKRVIQSPIALSTASPRYHPLAATPKRRRYRLPQYRVDSNGWRKFMFHTNDYKSDRENSVAY